jgi:two-component system phosphate regulon sensor histidine kinase PhoR
MVEGLLIVDLEGRVAVYNTSAESLLDLPLGSLHIGAPLPECPPRAVIRDLVAQAGIAREPGFVERSLTLAAGRTVRLQATRLPPAQGSVPSVFLSIRDAHEAERLETLRRDFVANVSHEVRTPLAAIRACSSTLLGGALGDNERARRFVEVIEHHAERLAQLVDDLGRLSDLEEGRMDLRCRLVPVEGVLRAAVEGCVERALAAGVAIDLSVADDVPAAQADGELLKQAVAMLIDNAVRYTQRGGRVAVSAATWVGNHAARGDTSWICLRVCDTGVGVPASELPRLSERFYRPDKGRSRERGGSGLGLALVKHIARAHGASMQIDSEMDRGTTVTLRWPAAAEGLATPEDRAAAQ